MAQEVVAPQSSKATEPFEYIVYEDTEHANAHVAPWIEPNSLKLSHRIGRGPFGDVWLAAHHLSTEDYDEYHEVAIKMLPYLQEEEREIVLSRVKDLFDKCQGIEGVCFLHGFTLKNEKICIVMKFHEGSLGDKLARLEGGKFELPDVVRYGTELVQSIVSLHSKEVLVLNLKPCNLLLNDANQLVLGEFGIPFLLYGISPSNSEIAWRLGTPNYMAPEQWQPDTRGPVSYETDSWGFGCCIVELLTGVQPWSGRSPKEIHQLVVIRKEKPNIPVGLPPAIDDILHGCFQYDLRDRPRMGDILEAFKSYKTGNYEAMGKRATRNGHIDWSMLKDPLEVGDVVRSRKAQKSCRPENMTIPEGTVVSLESDGFVLVRVHGVHGPRRIHLSALERVSYGFAAGDWVKIKGEQKSSFSVGILHSIDREGNATVAIRGKSILWRGHYSQLQMAESFCPGQFVRPKASISRPTFEWPSKAGGDWATGRISLVLANGCLAVVFPGRFMFGEEGEYLANPTEVEVVDFSTCQGFLEKYQHLEDFHWAVRPLVIALGLFTAVKAGIFVGKGLQRSRNKGRGDVCQEVSTGDRKEWLPSNVANILFRDR